MNKYFIALFIFVAIVHILGCGKVERKKYVYVVPVDGILIVCRDMSTYTYGVTLSDCGESDSLFQIHQATNFQMVEVP